jgi:hypothetical protein
VSLIEDHDQHLQTTIGGPAVPATVSQPGAVADVTFPGSAGEMIYVIGSASTLPSGCDAIGVVAPLSQLPFKLLCAVGDSGSQAAVTLPVSGTYTLVLDPSAREVGGLDLMVTAAK